MSASVVWFAMTLIGLAGLVGFLVLVFGPRDDGHHADAREPWER